LTAVLIGDKIELYSSIAIVQLQLNELANEENTAQIWKGGNKYGCLRVM
jgi:hypothetical protein